MISILITNLEGGGAERIAINLANEFSRRGYAVDMVLISATGVLLPDLVAGVRVVDLGVGRMRFALPALIRYLREAKPSAMLACMWPLTVIAIYARLLAGSRTRLVVAEHTTWSRGEIVSTKLGRWKVGLTMRAAFPLADAVVAVSKGAADDLSSFSGFRRSGISMIYNPIVSDIRPTLSTLEEPAGWWSGSHKRVLAVGVLKPIKGYEVLLDAFVNLRNRIDARLLILGDGPSREALMERIRQLNLEDSVFMPGFSKETFPYYKRADLHVLSSWGEGLPTVIVEALAAGTPVVSTDCPSGPREILCDGRFGQLVPVGNPAALAEAMEKSLEMVHDRSALEARAQDFSIGRGVDQYLDLLIPGVSAKLSV